ncbi:MAG: hypothetical protein Q9195_007233 [Heterodermia aff. obscurata]
MAGTTPASFSIAAGFDTARKEFLHDIPHEDVEVISKFTSVDDIYNATDEIQRKQGETRTLRNLGKIQPYLECLTQYSDVLDTIVQIKPDILAIIWAPLKMLLIVSGTYMKSYTKVLDSMAQIGAALPQFKAYAQLFVQSHSVQRNVTLTTLHSFLFQLIIDNKTLRPVLSHNYENNYRKLTSSPDFVRDLLKDILIVSPATYIVVDGLDEITELERPTLLASLIYLQKQCPTLRLLISSRAEYDISRDLGSQCETFHVHESNTQDILDYVETRIDAWLCGLNLDPDFVSQIRRLTKDIAFKSKGMFLYARLVCDSLESLSDTDDVNQEIENLPQGLNEAYGRILERIERGLKSSERAQARAILEWVSCSIFPVDQNEIGLALSIANGKDPFQGLKNSLLEVVRRCGPIIEIVNGHIYFVHFSAKDDCFYPMLSDQDITGGITRGAYVLQEYAISHWLEHVIRVLSNCDKTLSLKRISSAIEAMLELRENNGFETLHTGYVAHPSLKLFEVKTPEVFKALVSIHSFIQRRWSECSLDDGRVLIALSAAHALIQK